MFNLDLSTIEAPQAKEFELIPNGTIAPVIINIKGVKPTNAGDAQMLDIEFTVTAGDYARRKVFGLFMVMIAGFIGTVDLSQEIFRALTFNDGGKGLVIGLCVAFIGLTADRLLVEWAERRKRMYGIA